MKRILFYFAFFIVTSAFSPVFAAKIGTNKCLSHFNDHIINSETAWFDDCELTDKDIPTIVSYLNTHPKITQLYLLGNQIGDKGAILLAKNKTLTMLELRNNCIGTKGMNALAHSSIHMLDLQSNKFNASGKVTLAQNEKLETTNIGAKLSNMKGAIILS